MYINLFTFFEVTAASSDDCRWRLAAGDDDEPGEKTNIKIFILKFKENINIYSKLTTN